MASLISILGATLIYEVITEDDPMDKIDDAIMVVLGVVAVWWYKKTGHKGNNSNVAIWLSGLAVATKIMAVAIEHADKEAVGDDIGILLALLLAFGLVLWQVYSNKKK